MQPAIPSKPVAHETSSLPPRVDQARAQPSSATIDQTRPVSDSPGKSNLSTRLSSRPRGWASGASEKRHCHGLPRYRFRLRRSHTTMWMNPDIYGYGESCGQLRQRFQRTGVPADPVPGFASEVPVIFGCGIPGWRRPHKRPLGHSTLTVTTPVEALPNRSVCRGVETRFHRLPRKSSARRTRPRTADGSPWHGFCRGIQGGAQAPCTRNSKPDPRAPCDAQQLLYSLLPFSPGAPPCLYKGLRSSFMIRLKSRLRVQSMYRHRTSNGRATRSGELDPVVPACSPGLRPVSPTSKHFDTTVRS